MIVDLFDVLLGCFGGWCLDVYYVVVVGCVDVGILVVEVVVCCVGVVECVMCDVLVGEVYVVV